MRGILSPKLDDFIDNINTQIEQAAKEGIKPTPALARSRLEALAAFITREEPVSYWSEQSIQLEDHAVPVLVYSPDPAVALPVMVFFHGGGHMCGSAKLYDPICRRIANTAQVVVVSVDYRLAPEYPYPNALEEGEQVLLRYREVLQDVAHTETLLVCGDSAGGAMCTSLVARMVGNPDLHIAQQILVYPSVDYTMNMPSIEENGKGFFLEKPRIQWYFDNYLPADCDRASVSPLHMPLPDNLPRTLVIVAGCDPLRDEGLAYAERLSALNADVEIQNFEGMVHAFMNLEDLVPDECQQLYRCMGDFIHSAR
ncbi:alpha/beta hydrolase [Parahaliea maris]|uniref:Alpha/beta hydrolase n=1 Tax=Parahaliea maris TaxID=2716870 RepID=A0A5C9A3K6_9GAMM|nr:alpha/beta hydrolase [Parahaliea maris]TXS95296.1 alpha/beta hydrolase [Parahaliea maris]